MTQSRRIKLQQELEALLGSNKVYFQPPQNVKIGYPSIIYEMADIDSVYADNRSYKLSKSYSLTYITSNPDDELVTKIIEHFKFCSFDRVFKSENLYHNIFALYY